MDGRRFDELTRALAGVRTRRSVLQTLGGGIVAGAGAFAWRRGGLVAQDACESDDDCADDEICCAEACQAIECCIDDEDPNARCPEGTSCFEGICEATDEGCESDDDCGDDEICCVGTCRAIECCIDEEDPNARCPEGTSCFEGVCDPIDDGGDGGTGGDGSTDLPNTGSGSAVPGDASPVGALLVAGAAASAAIAARNLLRPAEAPARK
jgi:hypothetical protein